MKTFFFVLSGATVGVHCPGQELLSEVAHLGPDISHVSLEDLIM